MRTGRIDDGQNVEVIDLTTAYLVEHAENMRLFEVSLEAGWDVDSHGKRRFLSVQSQL